MPDAIAALSSGAFYKLMKIHLKWKLGTENCELK